MGPLVGRPDQAARQCFRDREGPVLAWQRYPGFTGLKQTVLDHVPVAAIPTSRLAAIEFDVILPLGAARVPSLAGTFLRRPADGSMPEWFPALPSRRRAS